MIICMQTSMFITPPSLQLLVDLATPFAALLDRLNSALPALFKTLPSEFSGAYTLVLRDVKDPLKGQVAVFYEFAHCGESVWYIYYEFTAFARARAPLLLVSKR